MIRLLIISLLLVSCKGNTAQINHSQVVSYQQSETMQSDTLLASIQVKITNAFVQSMLSKNNNKLNQLKKELAQLYKAKNQNLILYWQSYLQFFSSIYYLETGDRNTAEKEIDTAIDWINNMAHKNSEDYALLAMLEGFSIQFKGMKAMFIGPRAQKNVKTAIAIDSTNLRAYYVYASNDFYTPEKYGGGKEAEEYLLKALSLPVQTIKNNYLPSWGKEEAYELLIKLYIKQEKWELAKKYFQESIKEFPKSYKLNKLASKLIGK